MTTTDIKNLIASKIAGQGSAVDAGSALPEILNGIVEALEKIPAIPYVEYPNGSDVFIEITKEEFDTYSPLFLIYDHVQYYTRQLLTDAQSDYIKEYIENNRLQEGEEISMINSIFLGDMIFDGDAFDYGNLLVACRIKKGSTYLYKIYFIAY